MPSSRALARHDRPRKAMVCPTYGALATRTAPVRGVFLEDPPSITLYSPRITSQLSLSTLKMDRWSGSIARLTVLVSPGASWILSQATRRLGGSLAAAGSPASTCAISVPARLPVFFTLKLTFTSFPDREAFSPEYAKVAQA